ncbi:MAG: 2'-5' RNA ligase family protein [Firmicutes bacterium]|nr:2'-5' RNA ligase family protein [Bacillota bacterium]
MKYFVGLVLPDAFSLTLQNFCRRWPNNRHPEHVPPHITLKAPPGIGPNPDAWLERLRAVCAHTTPVPVSVGEARWFRRDVLYLSVDRAAVLPLHRCILYAFGEEAATLTEGEAYTPHVTIGMRSFGMSRDELEEMYAQVPSALATSAPGFGSTGGACEGERKDKPYLVFTPAFVRVFGAQGASMPWLPVADVALAPSDSR